MDTTVKDLDPTIKNEIEPIREYESMVVDDESSEIMASELVQSIKNYKKKVVDYFADLKEAAHKMHKNVCAKEKEALAPAEAIEKSLVFKINAYLNDKRLKELEAQRVAQAIADDAARVERERLAEEARKAEEAAQAALKSGDSEAAEKLSEQANELNAEAEKVEALPEIVQASKTIKTDAGSRTTTEDIELSITDKKALIEALFEKNLESYIDIDMGKLKRFCKDTQAEFAGLQIKKVVKASFRGNK
jgi:hypothetical protein